MQRPKRSVSFNFKSPSLGRRDSLRKVEKKEEKKRLFLIKIAKSRSHAGNSIQIKEVAFDVSRLR